MAGITKCKNKESIQVFVKVTLMFIVLRVYHKIHSLSLYIIKVNLEYMSLILQQRFFLLLLECSQRKVSASDFTEAIEELANHLADFSMDEQDNSVLLRYFSFGLHRLKSYRVQFEQEKNALFASN